MGRGVAGLSQAIDCKSQASNFDVFTNQEVRPLYGVA